MRNTRSDEQEQPHEAREAEGLKDKLASQLKSRPKAPKKQRPLHKHEAPRAQPKAVSSRPRTVRPPESELEISYFTLPLETEAGSGLPNDDPIYETIKTEEPLSKEAQAERDYFEEFFGKKRD